MERMVHSSSRPRTCTLPSSPQTMTDGVKLWSVCKKVVATLRDATTASNDDSMLRVAVWPTTTPAVMNEYRVLTETEWQRLLAAGLRLSPGVHDKEFYCFRNVPAFDGFSVRVLRLVQELQWDERHEGCSPPASPEEEPHDPGTTWMVVSRGQTTVEQTDEAGLQSTAPSASATPPRPVVASKETNISPEERRSKRTHKDSDNEADLSSQHLLENVELPSKARRVGERRSARKAVVLPTLLENKGGRAPQAQGIPTPAGRTPPPSSSSQASAARSPRASEVPSVSGSSIEELSAWLGDSSSPHSAKTTKSRAPRRKSTASEPRRIVTRSMTARSRQFQTDEPHREVNAATPKTGEARAGYEKDTVNDQEDKIKKENSVEDGDNSASKSDHEGAADEEARNGEDAGREASGTDPEEEDEAEEDPMDGENSDVPRTSNTQRKHLSTGTLSPVWTAVSSTSVQFRGVLRGAPWLSSIVSITSSDSAGTLELPEWDDDGGIWASLGFLTKPSGHGGLVVRTRRQCTEAQGLGTAWGL